jgi:hypothetical protein
MARRRSSTTRLIQQAGEIAEASHHVIALRSDMICAAFANPLDGNYPELNRMMVEKAEAATEIGLGLWNSWMQAGLDWSTAMMRQAQTGPMGPAEAMILAERVAADVATATLDPLHRRSRANHRRLKAGI